MTYAPNDSRAPFLNTVETFPEDQAQRILKMTSVHSDIANCVNVREIGTYQDGQQILTGQQFSSPGDNQTKKYAFRKMFYFGAVAAGAVLAIPHGIVGLVQLTHMYGTCITKAVDYRPIPFVSVTLVTDQIATLVIGANIVIANGATSSDITSGIIVVEYLLN